jgi:ribose 5-phosphate isomerase A
MTIGSTGGAAREELKRAAAEVAFASIESGMVLGLGTGSTVRHLVALIGEALREGRLRDVVGVPTSVQTERQAEAEGVPLVGLEERARIDLTIDGADEISPELDLIKGLGGALLREKMVAQASDRVLIIADAGKLVDRLGTLAPLPVEVVEWAFRAHLPYLEALGASPVLRVDPDGRTLQSDGGNVFLDCRFPDGIADAYALAAELAERAGVVDHGLFLGIADQAVVADEDGVRTLVRPR